MEPSLDIKNIPSDPVHRREWIKFNLRLKGIKLVDIANEAKTSNATVTKVVAGDSLNKRAQAVIADKLGLQFEDVWQQ